jgi:hypothetical protein
MFPICRIGKTYGDAPVALALCPATLPDLQNGKCQLRAQRYAPEMERRLRSRLKPTNDSWRVGEPYIRTQCAFRAWKAGQHDEIT